MQRDSLSTTRHTTPIPLSNCLRSCSCTILVSRRPDAFRELLLLFYLRAAISNWSECNRVDLRPAEISLWDSGIREGYSIQSFNRLTREPNVVRISSTCRMYAGEIKFARFIARDRSCIRDIEFSCDFGSQPSDIGMRYEAFRETRVIGIKS